MTTAGASSNEDESSDAVAEFTTPDGFSMPVGTDDQRYQLDTDGILTIKKVDFDDVGTYKCVPKRVDPTELEE